MNDKQFKLIQGDCLEVMQSLIDDGVKVDMVLTDPPYNALLCDWDNVIPFDKMWDRLNKISKDNAPMLIFSNDMLGAELKLSNKDCYKYQWVWDKQFSTNYVQVHKRPLIPLEYINVFYRKQPTYNPQRRPKTVDYDGSRTSDIAKKVRVNDKDNLYGKSYFRRYYVDDGTRYPINFITFNSQEKECNNSKRVHPSQKPVALLEYLIKTYTNESDLVLDFTMGSGSTGVACLQTNRKFIGIELEPKYYEIAKTRIKEANEQKKLI